MADKKDYTDGDWYSEDDRKSAHLNEATSAASHEGQDKWDEAQNDGEGHPPESSDGEDRSHDDESERAVCE